MRGGLRRGAALALALAALLGGCRREAAPQPTPEPTPTPTPTAAPTPTPAPQKREFVLPCGAEGDLHPIRGENRASLTLAPLLYGRLFVLDERFQPRRELCAGESVSEDGLTWTFQLVDITFSDGSPLTAAEAAASLDLARRTPRFAGRLADVQSVRAVEGAVVVKLSRPNGALPALLDIPIVKETADPKRPLGTGAYVAQGEGEALVLTARDGAAAPLERIALRAVGAGDELVHAFDAGEISLVDVDLTGTNPLGYSGRLETTDYPTSTLLYVGCNTLKGACGDARVRQALGLAFDRREAVETLLAGHAAASALPVHPDADGYDAALAKSLERDTERAAELLEQAGWAVGEDGLRYKRRGALALRLLVNQENTWKVSLAQALGEALEALGCTVTVEKLPFEAFVAALEKGNFDLYLGETTLTADFDPATLVGRTGALNYGGYEDWETEGLLQDRRAARGAARTQASRELCEKLAQDAPILPLCFKNGSVLTQWGQVSGLAPVQRDAFRGLSGWKISQT